MENSLVVLHLLCSDQRERNITTGLFGLVWTGNIDDIAVHCMVLLMLVIS